ncbi:MAG TPA: PQQ-dependent sugar dehydrogenase [Gemmatimonadota bacterium]|nr:PQQ-dependent sugar dehydrogenase [Gemmatimonadota bacterium]
MLDHPRSAFGPPRGCTRLAAIALAGLAVACADPVEHPALPAPGVVAEVVADSLEFAVQLAFLPDGRRLYTEKLTGRVRLMAPDGTVAARPVLDVPVAFSGERGLAGLTLSPDFVRDRSLYIWYTGSPTDEDTHDREPEGVAGVFVERYRLDGDSIAGPGERILKLPARPGPFHNGGNVRFGPDGRLYVSLGELNKNASLNAQRTGNPMGSILRYNPDGTIPVDNPLGPDNPIWAYGLRNPFGFTFDPADGALWIADNGPAGHDRVLRMDPGENAGWPFVWGLPTNPIERVAAAIIGAEFRPAVWESYQARVAPTGIVVLRDHAYGPALDGRVLVGFYNTGRVLQLELDPTRTRVVRAGTFVEGLAGGVTDLELGPGGRLWALTATHLYRLDPAGAGPPPLPAPDTLRADTINPAP